MSAEDKFAIRLSVIYLLGALLTNSYCQVYRYADWKKANGDPSVPIMQICGATAGWPIYWASKLTVDGLKSLQRQPVPEIEGDGFIKLQ